MTTVESSTTTRPRTGVGPGPAPTDRGGAVAGVVGAGLGLGLAELVAGVAASVPSPVDAVAAQIVPVLPGDLVTWAIETLGASDRLVIGLVVAAVVLGLGGVAGRLAARGRHAEAIAIFAALAAVATIASLADVGASLAAAAIVFTGAGVVGWVAVRWLLRSSPAAASSGASGAPATSAPGRVAGPVSTGAHAHEGGEDTATAARPAGDLDVVRRDGADPIPLDRRRFLAAAASVGAVGVAAGTAGRLLGRRDVAGPDSRPVAVELPAPDEALPPAPASSSFDVAGLTPLFVPNDDFYRIDTALTGPPAVDLSSWRLRVHGLVDRELTLDFPGLVDRGLVESDVTIACVSNEVGGGLVGNARWTGVPLAPLLDEAGVRGGGTQVVGRSVDGFTAGFPIEAATDGRDAMVAVAMNGEPLPVAHGFPARLVVPGLYGYVSATKWLSEIELVGWEDFDAYWIRRSWAKEGPIKTQSRIDTVVAADGGAPTAGPNVVAGVAWAPTRGIEAVEVRVDDGPWQPATLAEPLDLDTWVQWRVEVDLAPGDHTLQVRATDGTGQVQPEPPTPEHPDGAEGWHQYAVTV